MRKYVLLSIAALLILSACSNNEPQTLVIYSGRSESLVAPVIEMFEAASGIDAEVRYGGTAEMAATLLEEGQNSPADLFWAQDPGGLGAVAAEGLFAQLPDDILEIVPEGFRSPNGDWVGITGRARVVVYNTELVNPEDLPDDIWDYIDPQWDGRIGWAPTNGSLQVMVTAMRNSWGEAKTAEWLNGIMANHPVEYDGNNAVVAAVAAGEVEVGFANHYYLYRFLAEEGEGFTARNDFLTSDGPGSLVMVAGAGVLASSEDAEGALDFVRFLLSQEAQEYFSTETFEYPMLSGVPIADELAPLDTLSRMSIDLADLADLQGTVALLQSVGALP